MNKLRTIALVIPGGIGTGKNNIGVPVFERIVRLLSADFDLQVFQLYPRNKDYAVRGFTLIDVHSPFIVVRLIKFLFAFIRINRQKHFDAVHGFWALPGGLLAVLMGKLLGIKSLVSILGGDAIALPEIGYGQLRNSFYRKLIFWTLREANEVIALTQYLVKNLKHAGFTRRDIQIIPWGIDPMLFTYMDKPLGSNIGFLHVGNLNPVKDQRTLLRAFKLISDEIDATLTIIGEGILEDYILALIKELQLETKVNLVKPLPYEGLPAYYHAADVLLHTSISEGQCEVVTEAMSSGLLVCGTSVGLMDDLPECCISVNVGDYKQLAVATIAALRNPSLLTSVKYNAKHWSARHTIEWTAQQIRGLYLSHEERK